METKHTVFSGFLLGYFVETGSYAGDGIQAALDTGFPNIISLEVGRENYLQCKLRFYEHKNVQVYHTDSAINLWEYIKHIDEPITFWLDAHWSGEGTPEGLVKMPILYELEHIKRHKIKIHNILIDDVRTFRGYSPVRDFELSDIITKIKSINPAYKIDYADGTEPNDVLIASI